MRRPGGAVDAKRRPSQPGQTFSCIGCHERARRRPPPRIRRWPPPGTVEARARPGWFLAVAVRPAGAARRRPSCVRCHAPARRTRLAPSSISRRPRLTARSSTIVARASRWATSSGRPTTSAGRSPARRGGRQRPLEAALRSQWPLRRPPRHRRSRAIPHLDGHLRAAPRRIQFGAEQELVPPSAAVVRSARRAAAAVN